MFSEVKKIKELQRRNWYRIFFMIIVGFIIIIQLYDLHEYYLLFSQSQMDGTVGLILICVISLLAQFAAFFHTIINITILEINYEMRVEMHENELQEFRNSHTYLVESGINLHMNCPDRHLFYNTLTLTLNQEIDFNKNISDELQKDLKTIYRIEDFVYKKTLLGYSPSGYSYEFDFMYSINEDIFRAIVDSMRKTDNKNHNGMKEYVKEAEDIVRELLQGISQKINTFVINEYDIQESQIVENESNTDVLMSLNYFDEYDLDEDDD